MTRQIHAAGKPIACVCHGIEILTAADCIAGRTVTTVAKCALDAAQGGAQYVDQEVVVDGHLVTARTWHDNYRAVTRIHAPAAGCPLTRFRAHSARQDTLSVGRERFDLRVCDQCLKVHDGRS